MLRYKPFFFFMKFFVSFFASLSLCLFLSSCGFSWEKLDPTYIEPTLGKANTQTPIIMPDGRDISGYPIPHTASPTQTVQVNPQK